MENYYSISDTAEQQKFKDFLYNLLNTGTVTVKFVKADGAERTMRCTLQENLINYTKVTESTKKSNPEVCSVWDVELQAWRSFRFDRIKEVAADL